MLNHEKSFMTFFKLTVEMAKNIFRPCVHALLFIKSNEKYIRRDAFNIINYGLNSPRSAERLFVNPNDIKIQLVENFGRSDTGRVVYGNWDLNTIPLHYNTKIKIVYKKFDLGISWKEAGAYEHMKEKMRITPGVDGLFDDEDIQRRYEELDSLISHLKEGNKLLERNRFREKGGIYVHIGRRGQLIFGGGGHHRLAICQKLAIYRIPVQVGVVHYDAVKNGLIAKYR